MYGLIEPHGPQIKPAFAHQHAQQRAAGAGVAQLGFFDHAANRDQLVFLQIGDAAQIGEVLIIAREDRTARSATFQDRAAAIIRPRAGPTPLRNCTGCEQRARRGGGMSPERSSACWALGASTVGSAWDMVVVYTCSFGTRRRGDAERGSFFRPPLRVGSEAKRQPPPTSPFSASPREQIPGRIGFAAVGRFP